MRKLIVSGIVLICGIVLGVTFIPSGADVDETYKQYMATGALKSEMSYELGRLIAEVDWQKEEVADKLFVGSSSEINGRSIIYYSQKDERWGSESYGRSGTIYDSGCGPTSLAMIVSSLTNNPDITPSTMAKWSVDNGHRAEGAGSYWSLMTKGGENWNLKVTPVLRTDRTKIKEFLANGTPMIVSMGPGDFTNGGHFIVLVGLDENGLVIVNDAYSIVRSQKAWDLTLIMNQSSLNGGANGSPFWAFEKKGE